MITKGQAEAVARKWLDEQEIELVITRVDEHTWGWMFFYQSKNYVETGGILNALAGNCPVYVTRGAFHEAVAGSGVPVAEHLKIFGARLGRLAKPKEK